LGLTRSLFSFLATVLFNKAENWAGIIGVKLESKPSMHGKRRGVNSIRPGKPPQPMMPIAEWDAEGNKSTPVPRA
jgi:hypothetical protein